MKTIQIIIFSYFFIYSFCKVESDIKNKNEKFTLENARIRLKELIKTFEHLVKIEEKYEKQSKVNDKDNNNNHNNNNEKLEKENNSNNNKEHKSYESLKEEYKTFSQKIENLYSQINDYITKPTETIPKEAHDLLRQALMLKLESKEHLNNLDSKKNTDL